MTARLDLPVEPPLAQRGTAPAAPRWQDMAMLALAAIAAVALAVLAAATWLHGTRPALQPGPAGAWYAVQLQNGQMFYGVLRAAGPAQLELAGVYYVQPFTQPDGRQGNRLVSRQKNDWHGPATLVIPAGRVVTVEAIGADSQLARLIAQDRGAAANGGAK